MDLKRVNRILFDLRSALADGDAMEEDTKKDVSKYIEEAHGDHEGCGPDTDGDDVDQAIIDAINMVEKSGYEFESSEAAVFDALASLIEEGHISDTPDIGAVGYVKSRWISSFQESIVPKLIELGIELTE